LQCEETTGYKLRILVKYNNNKNSNKKKHIFEWLVVKVVSDQHLQVTTRCRRGDGCRIHSKPGNCMARLLHEASICPSLVIV